MYCSREYQLTSRFIQQYEKSTSKFSKVYDHVSRVSKYLKRYFSIFGSSAKHQTTFFVCAHAFKKLPGTRASPVMSILIKLDTYN